MPVCIQAMATSVVFVTCTVTATGYRWDWEAAGKALLHSWVGLCGNGRANWPPLATALIIHGDNMDNQSAEALEEEVIRFSGVRDKSVAAAKVSE